jgi:hypothetical protein
MYAGPAKRVDYECYSRGGGLNLAPNCGARSVCRTEGDADVRNYEV